MSASNFSRWVEIAKDVCEILAIFGGAAWTYLNYFRGRIHKLKLECSVEASIETHAGRSFLKTVATVRNIGLSKVPIQQKGTALLVYSVNMQGRTPTFPIQVRWNEPVAAFDVFSGRKWVEPLESISESLMVDLPHGGAFIYKVILKVVSGEILWTAEWIVADTQDRKR